MLARRRLAIPCSDLDHHEAHLLMRDFGRHFRSAHMIARRILLLVAVVIASVPVHSAQNDSSMLGIVGKSSFWLDVPAGWTADQQAAKRFGVVFVLVPPGANFNSAGVVIVGGSYKD